MSTLVEPSSLPNSSTAYCRGSHRHYLRGLEQFHQHCLRTIQNSQWSDFIINMELLEIPKNTRAGHASQMGNHHQLLIILCDELSSGHQRNDTRNA